jgi:hypothetical protein
MNQYLIHFIMGDVSQELRGSVFRPQLAKSAPAYMEGAVPRQVTVGNEKRDVFGRSVDFELRGYPPDVLLVVARVEVADVISRDTFPLEEEVARQAREILEARGGTGIVESYSVFVVSGYNGPPEEFLERAPIIASLLKSERLELDQREVDYTLLTQIKYAKGDLAIIDWDGAFLFDPDNDVEEDLEILMLANLQLLRYRTLDRSLDERFERLGLIVRAPRSATNWKTRDFRGDLRELVEARATSILDLQKLEREIKLIGDWYSARFFEMASNKFKIGDWRRSVRDKLESLEDLFSTIMENFSVSGKHRAEWVQIILFFILQLGWFVLLAIEFSYFTRK